MNSNQTALGLPINKTNLRSRIKTLSYGRVIVLGDLLIDELVEGTPERISREAPVLILEHVDTQLIPGGAANTANNIKALGGSCHAIGVCGEDEYAKQLAKLFDLAGIEHSLIADSTRPTTVKTRILSKSFSFRQQLLRLDRISHFAIAKATESLLVHQIEKVADHYQAIILSDYRGGVITDGIIESCRKIAKRSNLLLIADAQANFERFCGVTLMTPNQPDTESMVGFTINDTTSLKQAGEKILALTDAYAVLITRGAAGMALFEKNGSFHELPAFNRSDVFDVSGAGDTVVATMTLALVSGSSFVEAMALGNLAASIVVKKPGTAVVSQAELLHNLDQLPLPE